MGQKSTISGVRKTIGALRAKRKKLEAGLLRSRRMLDACLIERYALAGGKRRRSPAYYLSRKVGGKTKLTYVQKAERARVRRATEAWREFSSAMAQWVKVNRQLEGGLRQLGRVQVVSSPREAIGR